MSILQKYLKISNTAKDSTLDTRIYTKINDSVPIEDILSMGNIDHLDDVNLTNLSNNDMFVYNSTDSKWINATPASSFNAIFSETNDPTKNDLRLLSNIYGGNEANSTTSLFLRKDGTWSEPNSISGLSVSITPEKNINIEKGYHLKFKGSISSDNVFTQIKAETPTSGRVFTLPNEVNSEISLSPMYNTFHTSVINELNPFEFSKVNENVILRGNNSQLNDKTANLFVSIPVITTLTNFGSLNDSTLSQGETRRGVRFRISRHTGANIYIAPTSENSKIEILGDDTYDTMDSRRINQSDIVQGKVYRIIDGTGWQQYYGASNDNPGTFFIASANGSGPAQGPKAFECVHIKPDDLKAGYIDIVGYQTGSGSSSYVYSITKPTLLLDNPTLTGTTTISGSANLSSLTLENDLLVKSGIKINEPSGGSEYIKLLSPSLSSNYTLTLPAAVPTENNSTLISDTNGDLSWQTYPTLRSSIFGDITGDITFPNPANRESLIVVNSVTKSKLEKINSMKVLGNLTNAQSDVLEVTVSSSTELGGETPDDTTLVTQKAVKTYIDSRLVSTSSEPTSEFSINLTDNTKIEQTLQQNPDDSSKQHWFFNDEVGFEYTNVELTNTSFGISNNILIQSTPNPNIKYKGYSNTNGSSGFSGTKDHITCQNRTTFKRMIAKAYLQKYLVYRYTTSDWNTALGSNYLGNNVANRFPRRHLNGFLAFMPMTAYGVPSPDSFIDSQYWDEVTNSSSWHTGGRLELDHNWRKDCTGRGIRRDSIYIGGGGTNLKNNQYNMSHFMSKYSDTNINNQFNGIPTVFLPELDQDISYSSTSNDLLGKKIILSIKNNSTYKTPFIVTKSKNNNGNPISSYIDANATKDYTVELIELLERCNINFIVPSNHPLYGIDIEPIPVESPLGGNIYSMQPISLPAYLRQKDVAFQGRYDGVTINSTRTDQNYLFDFTNYYIPDRVLDQGQEVVLECTVGKINVDYTNNSRYTGNDGSYNLYNWQINDIT